MKLEWFISFSSNAMVIYPPLTSVRSGGRRVDDDCRLGRERVRWDFYGRVVRKGILKREGKVRGRWIFLDNEDERKEKLRERWKKIFLIY